jgi:hypothetical protein
VIGATYSESAPLYDLIHGVKDYPAEIFRVLDALSTNELVVEAGILLRV